MGGQPFGGHALPPDFAVAELIAEANAWPPLDLANAFELADADEFFPDANACAVAWAVAVELIDLVIVVFPCTVIIRDPVFGSLCSASSQRIDKS